MFQGRVVAKTIDQLFRTINQSKVLETVVMRLIIKILGIFNLLNRE